MKHICERCKAVFDEEEIIDRVVDLHPYGGSYAFEYACCCPECGSLEICEAFECCRCGEYYPVDLRHWHPTEDMLLCPDCLDIVETEIEEEQETQYDGIDDPFKMLDRRIGA